MPESAPPSPATEPRFDVVGIGNAIVDVLVKADDDVLDNHGLTKGTMALVDESQAQRLYASVGPGLETSGGSAANTLAGIAQLGGRAGFIGRVRDDQLGAIFAHDIRAVGANARAASFAGVSVTRTVVLVAMLSGALAGLAGAIEVAGRTSYLTLDMSPGYGYSGIVIAMLAALHPLGVVAASVFVAGVLVGADSMSRAIGVPTYIADVIVAASLISVLVATLLTQYKVRWK